MGVLKELLTGRIQKVESCKDWEEAVRLAANPLIESKSVNQSYVDAMIKNISTLGAYMILLPGVAMPHSRPEDGCIKGGLSLLKLDKPVIFPADNAVWLILALGATSADSHIETIEALADFLDDEETISALEIAKSTNEILNLIP
ncbi:MAG: PTS sugar transporter subunit IIA [Treponemataceae bacterium]